MRREFVLQKQEQDKYYITEIDALKSIIKSCECSPTYTLVEGEQEDVTVICDPNFMHELLAYYHWGENHPNNYYEDVFRIAGQVLHNQETKSTILIARFLVKVVASERSKTAAARRVPHCLCAAIVCPDAHLQSCRCASDAMQNRQNSGRRHIRGRA